MPTPKVFISSTFNDLSDLRSQLSTFLKEYGFDPILSEKNDIFYDPELGAMESCLEAVKGSNLLILIIGGRYGSIYDHENGKSIVNAEYEAARSIGIPTFTFIKKDILHGLKFFNENKKLTSKKLVIPGVTNQDDIPRIFAFLNSIIGEIKNNAVFSFETTSEIKEALKKQFAAYFLKNMLSNNISKKTQTALYDIEYQLNEVTIKFDIKNSVYKIEFHKILRNLSGRPISQVIFHFLSNVYPQNPEKSYEYYLKNPVFWSALNVRGWDLSGDLEVKLVNDHGSRKDFLIAFRKHGVDIPILQKEDREFWYRYDVPFNLWGPYIDRPITFPTKTCNVRLIVPKRLSIDVGGYQISPFRPKSHLEQKITKDIIKSNSCFFWSSDRLVIGDTYQIYWSDFMGLGYGRTDTITTSQNYVMQ